MNKCHDPCGCQYPDDLNMIAKGDPGKSAYEVWLTQPGNEGKTVAEFLASLKADIDVATKEDIDTILDM